MNSNNNKEDGTKTIKAVYDMLLKETQVPILQSIPLHTYQDILLYLVKIKGTSIRGVGDCNKGQDDRIDLSNHKVTT